MTEGASETDRTLRGLLEPVLEAMGYELVCLERPAGGGLLRLYIDAEAGITVDDCEAVSRQVSGVLDVEDPLPGAYRLEVSSPGLDRPLVKPEHFERFSGARVKLRLIHPQQGRRRYKGRLRGMEDGTVMVEADGECYRLALDNIDMARLVPEV